MPKPKPGRHASTGVSPRPTATGRGKPRTLEDAVVALASAGKLAEAGRCAIRAQRRAGLPVTYMDGDEIVTEYLDKRRVVLRTVTPPIYKIPKGVTKIRSA